MINHPPAGGDGCAVLFVGPLLRAHLLATRKLEVVWPAAIVSPPGAAPPGCPSPASIHQQTPTAACASDAAAPITGGLGPSAINKRHRVYTGALLAITAKAYKKGLNMVWIDDILRFEKLEFSGG